jgi:serine/threonine protein kinase
MWALGLILFELTTKTFPMSNIPQIFDDIPLEIPDDVPPLIKTLLEQLLNKNPAIRPSAEELLN